MTLQIPHEVEQLPRLVASKTGKTPDDILRGHRGPRRGSRHPAQAPPFA